MWQLILDCAQGKRRPETKISSPAQNGIDKFVGVILTSRQKLFVTEKRGGAWMDEVCGQSKLFAAPGESLRLPVAHMVCNQTPPIGDKPSLMTFR